MRDRSTWRAPTSAVRLRTAIVGSGDKGVNGIGYSWEPALARPPATAPRTGVQLSPTTSAGWNTTWRGVGGALALMRPISMRKASLTMSLIGCSVRVRRGRRPPIPGMVSVEAIEMLPGVEATR